jgi:arginase
MAAELTERLGAAGPFWLHLDVDVLDEAVFPATAYPQPDGLDWGDLAALLAALAG